MQVKLTGLLGNYDSQAYRPTYQPTVRRFIWKFHRNRGPSCSFDGTYGRFDVFSLFCFQLKWIKWKTFIIPINISHFSAESKRTWYRCIFITTSVIEKGPKKGVSALNVIFPKKRRFAVHPTAPYKGIGRLPINPIPILIEYEI